MLFVTYSQTLKLGVVLFHFGQSLWRQVQRLGLQTLYANEPTIKESVSYLQTLPFVPLDDLTTVFDYLYNEIEGKVVPLWQYLEYNYIRGKAARGRRAAVSAQFPPPLWNVVEATLNGFARTNNYVEGWHNKLAHLLIIPHANIWKFLEYLKKEQRDNEAQISQYEGGHHNIRHPVSSFFF